MPVVGDPHAPEPTIFEKSRPGRRSSALPALDVPDVDAAEALPGVALADEPPVLPEVGELDLVRHFTRLSHRNHGIDVGFYPLGSCSMKYNPRLAETVAGLPGFRDGRGDPAPDGAAKPAPDKAAPKTPLNVIDEFDQRKRYGQIRRRGAQENCRIAGIGEERTRVREDVELVCRQPQDRYERRVLDEYHEFVHEGRDDSPDGLRNDHIAHRLKVGHSQRSRRLGLTFLDRLDAGTEDLGHVCAVVEAQRDYAGSQAVQPDAQVGQGEVDEQDLNEQRRAADELDLREGELLVARERLAERRWSSQA